MKMQLAEIARVVQAKNDVTPWATQEIASVSFDSRTLTPGALFVPLVAAQDGHRFIESARQHGATATFWQAGHSDEPTDFPVLEVDDPLTALQQLARYYLLKVDPRVVAITGSDGKTTTKDMTAAILKKRFNVHKTQGNFNNEIGVPMTILSMETNTEVLVVEMGMDRPGQLDFLSQMVAPDVAVITMIGEAHIEFFGTRAKIADAKLEITHGLKDDGFFIYEGDEPLLHERAEQVHQQQRTFGQSETCELYPIMIESTANETRFRLNKYPDLTFSLPLLGSYNVNNAMAAIQVGALLRIKPAEMQAALAHFDLTRNRTQWVSGANGVNILSDVYNANPTAMRAVLRAFQAVPTQGRRIAVLGDMLELGDQAATLHASVAEAVDPTQLDEVYLYGDLMQALATALKAQPDYAAHVHYFPTAEKEQLSQALLADVQTGDAVLLKASNGMHLDTILRQLKD